LATNVKRDDLFRTEAEQVAYVALTNGPTTDNEKPQGYAMHGDVRFRFCSNGLAELF
jgi:hypothetical protein